MRSAILIAVLSGCECAGVRDDLKFRCEPGCPSGFSCVGDYCERVSGAGGGNATAGGAPTAGGAAGGAATAGGAPGGGTGTAGGSAGGGTPQPGVFVWEHPVPYGHAINAMASTANDVYAVGDRGLILHRRGLSGQWFHEPSGTTFDLNGVAVSPDGSYVMAVGEGGVVVQQGPAGTWETRATGTTMLLRSVAWNPALNRFVSAGSANQLQLWDFTGQPTPMTGPPANGELLWVDSAMAVVSATEIFIRDAGSWVLSHDEGTANFYAVDGRWAVGRGSAGSGVVMGFDGGRWAPLPQPAMRGGAAFRAVTSFGAGDCAAVGEFGIAYFCGTSTRNDWPKTDIDLYAVTHSAGTTWAGGRSTLVLQSNGGAAFVPVDVGITGQHCQQLNAIGGSGTVGLFAGGTGSTTLVRNGNGTWVPTLAVQLPGTVLDIATAPNGDVWIVGDDKVGKGFFADGGELNLNLSAMNPTAVAATATAVWIASGGQVVYANLATPDMWNSATVAGLAVTGLAVTGDGGIGSAFAVTMNDLTRPGVAGVLASEPGSFFEDLWISPTGDIFVAGGRSSAVLRRTTVAAPGALTPVTTCAQSGLVAVHGTSSTDVWAAEGAGRAVIHVGAGGVCARHALPFNSQPTDIFVTPTDVWVTGRDCAVFHMVR